MADNAGTYVKSLVFGGLDGIITTFAIVATVAGARAHPGLVLLMGAAQCPGARDVGAFWCSKRLPGRQMV